MVRDTVQLIFMPFCLERGGGSAESLCRLAGVVCNLKIELYKLKDKYQVSNTNSLPVSNPVDKVIHSPFASANVDKSLCRERVRLLSQPVLA
jgi:hypothetical protein